MPTRPLFSVLPAIAALSFSLCMSAAHADNYADVNRLINAGQLAQALTRADAHLAVSPKDPQMRFLKGVVQTQAGKSNEAIALFTQITTDYPELAEPYNNLAVLYAAQGQLDKARATLEMAIRANPIYATAHENLGDVYAQLANQSYQLALQQDANNPSLRPKLAIIRQLLTPVKP